MGRAAVVVGLTAVALWAMASSTSPACPPEEYMETAVPLRLRRLESAEVNRRRFRPRPRIDDQAAPAPPPAPLLVPAPATAPAPATPSGRSPSIAPAGKTAGSPPAGGASSAGSSRSFSLGFFFCTLFVLASSACIIL